MTTLLLQNEIGHSSIADLTDSGRTKDAIDEHGLRFARVHFRVVVLLVVYIGLSTVAVRAYEFSCSSGYPD
jgi:hypothetical protein